MPAILLFLFFIALAYLLGAVVAYPLKLVLEPYLDLEYKKYINYATLLCGLLVSALYLKTCGVLSKQAFGFSGSIKSFFNLLLKSFAYGILLILIIELILYLLGIYELNPRRSYTLHEFVIRIIKALVSGLLISLLEETIFRGGLFAGLHKQVGAVLAVITSSLLYATVHFVRYREVPEGKGIDWITGLMMMPDAFRRFYEWSIIDYFMTLFMFGVLLALLRLRFNNLAACIGIHAGAVGTVKMTNYYGQRISDNQFDFLVNQYNSTFGWLSFIVLSVFTVIFYLRKMKPK